MSKKKKQAKGLEFIDDSKHLLVFRVPADEVGFKFVEDFRSYLNTNNYELSTRYTGKRVPSNAGHTKKENATSIRGYVKPKSNSVAYKNARVPECLVEDTDVPNVTDVSDMYYALAIKDEEMERMQKELLALNNRLAEQVQWNLELQKEDKKSNVLLQNKLDAKENEMKLEITAHTMMREERDKLKTRLAEKDSHYNAIYNSKVKEWNKELSVKDTEIDRLNTKVDNEVCEGNCVSHDDWDAEWIRANVLQDKLNVILGIVEIAEKHKSNGCHHTSYWAIKTIAEYEGDTNA